MYEIQYDIFLNAIGSGALPGLTLDLGLMEIIIPLSSSCRGLYPYPNPNPAW